MLPLPLANRQNLIQLRSYFVQEIVLFYLDLNYNYCLVSYLNNILYYSSDLSEGATDLLRPGLFKGLSHLQSL